MDHESFVLQDRADARMNITYRVAAACIALFLSCFVFSVSSCQKAREREETRQDQIELEGLPQDLEVMRIRGRNHEISLKKKEVEKETSVEVAEVQAEAQTRAQIEIERAHADLEAMRLSEYMRCVELHNHRSCADALYPERETPEERIEKAAIESQREIEKARLHHELSKASRVQDLYETCTDRSSSSRDSNCPEWVNEMLKGAVWE